MKFLRIHRVPLFLLAVAIIFSPFLFLEPLEVGGNSMNPTVESGDRIIVEKVSKYFKAPQRGEILVFREPHERKEIFVKRVIGLSGETVKVEPNSVVITHSDGREEVFASTETIEKLKKGAPFASEKRGTLFVGGELGAVVGGEGNTPHTRVLGPEDYFVMGDNRKVSSDSREWGTVQTQDIIGRPLIILHSSEEKRGTLLSQRAQKGAPLGLGLSARMNLAKGLFWLLSLGKDVLHAEAIAFTIDQSLRFNDDDSPYLTRTPSISGNRKTWTISLWFKRANVNARVMPISAHTAANNRASIDIQSDGDSNTFSFIDITTTVNSNLITTQRLRDPAAWDHWVVGHDSTQATASDRIKIWHNGVRVTAFSTETYPSLDRQTLINLVDVPNDIGRIYSGSTFSDAYKADFYLIDGLQLDADSFGETDTTTGSWKPKAVASTYGTNGFHLDFADNSTANALGTDVSGNGNDFTASGLATTDQMSDTPTNNYATLNSVQEVWGQAVTLSDGNLHVTGTGVTVWNNTSATFTMKSGKWIWAVKPDQAGAGRGDPFITNETGRNARANNYTGSANSWGPTVDTTTAFITYAAGSGTTHTLSPAFATGDLVLIAFDADAKKAWFCRYDASTGVTEWADGSTGWTGDPAAGTNETVTVTGNEFWAGFSALSGRTFDVDFGQNSLMSGVTIPTGFNFFNTTNLSAPTIPDPSAHFQTTAYTGTGATLNVTQGGHSTFQPDVVWIKTRNVANIPGLWDAVRGTGKELVPSEADAEGTRQG